MAAKTGESKQALIITLVVFVILSIILGITTYLGFDGQKALESKEKEAKADKAKWEKAADWYRFQALQYRAYMGGPMAGPEMEALGTLRTSFGDTQDGALVTGADLDANRAATAKLIRDDLDKRLAWDPAAKKAANSFANQVQDLQAKVDAATKRSNETQALLDQNNKTLKETTDALKKATEDYAANLTKLEATFSKKQEDYLASIDNLQQELRAKGETGALDKGKSDQEVNKSKKETKDLLKQIAQLEIKNKNLEKQIPKLDPIALDQYKAKVDSLDKSGRIVYINVGTSDNVQPQLTFRIVGASLEGKPGKEKGSLEVVKAIGPHSSQARVTELLDSNREPVMSGDLLYNPSWSPNTQKHVAVAGIVDLSGEGLDKTKEFIRGLKQHGIAVDAYVDLKDTAIKGEITRLTEFLILAPLPQDLKIKVAKDKQEGFENKVKELINSAKANGVTEVQLPVFMNLVGYRVPKAIQESEDKASFRFGGQSAGSVPAANGKEPTKEEASTDKKDKSDKGEQDQD